MKKIRDYASRLETIEAFMVNKSALAADALEAEQAVIREELVMLHDE